MKLAITGPLADKNLGDYGMFVNNLYDLGPTHEYTVFSYSSDFVELLKSDFLADFNLNFIDIELQEKQKESLSLIEKLKKIRRFILGMDKVKYPTPLEIINRSINYKQIKSAILECDVLVVSGGGYFNDLWYEWDRNDDLFKIIIPIIFAAQLKKKIVFTANGYGPFDSSKQFYSMLFAEAKNAFIGCRDNKLSPLYLSDLGVKNIELLPDDLYFTNTKLMESSASDFYERYIILELYGGIRDLKKNIEKLNLIVNMFNKQGIKTVFMPFDVDNKTKDFLKSNVSSSGFEIYEFGEYLKLDDAISMLKNAELVICNRYHALVLSVANQTPVINIIKPVGDYRYYYNKNAGFLDNAFGSENIDYNDFITESLDDVFTLLSQSYDAHKETQKELYNSNIYIKNKQKLLKMRQNYFQNIILGECNE